MKNRTIRGLIKNTLLAFTATTMLFSNTLLPQAAPLFYNDVTEADWFYQYVNEVFKSGWMTGMDENIFGPYEILSRAQFATILYRAEGQPETTSENVFSDVSGEEWYADAVLWAAENNIVTGYEDGCFGPADVITREQMAVMLYRYAGYKGYDMSESVDLNAYPDAAGVSDFAKDAVTWCVAKGIISGNNGSLNPVGNTTRAECATMVYRFLGASQLENKAGEFIVTYAEQFVGNPYRYGGDDLINGIDCSHFVYRILLNCGVYNEEYVTSSGWRTKGTAVASLEEAQAGDVICYSGHVGIFDGQDKIIEAKGEQWGITHDRHVNHAQILAIRRFV